MNHLSTPPPSSSHQPSHQLNREAKWSIYLTLIYLIGWIIFAYFVPHGMGLLGFPLWFELSCIFLPLIFILISMVVLKAVYQEMDLDSEFHDNLNNRLNDKPNHHTNQGGRL